MKKAAIILSIVFVVSLVGFVCSAAAFGVNRETLSDGVGIGINGFGVLNAMNDISLNYYNKGEEFVTDLDKEASVKDICINIANAETVVKVGDTDTIHVEYKINRQGSGFNAYVSGDKLIVQEDNAWIWFSWLSFGTQKNTLSVTLPEREYRDVSVAIASGSIDIDGLISKKFTSETASGSGDYNVYAEELRVDMASGSVKLNNCTENLVKSFRFDCASGSVSADGLSGEGKIDIASGKINLSYAEWNDDIRIDAASGNINITLPTGSGAEIDLDGLSGSVDADLDGKTASFRGESSGSVGGDNVHKAEIDLASGSVSFHN